MKDKLIITTNELNDLAFKIINDNIDINNKNKKLKEELKETQEKLLKSLNIIDKSIEYIEKYKFKGNESLNDRYLDNILSNNLLDILKGE